jgi:uncharacterized protein YabE (DUF348 family)
VQATLLAGVLGGTVAFATRDHHVHLVVDGQERTVDTYASTVGGVLAQDKVLVGAHDIVSPALSSEVGSGGTITLHRGRPIGLTVGTSTNTVWVTGQTVGAALDQLGLTASDEYVSAPRSTPISLAGTALSVRLPQRVTLVHDGRATPVTTTAPTVARLLESARLSLGALDTLSVSRAAYPTMGMLVKITRVHNGQLVDDDVIAPTVARVPDGSLYTGQSQVARPGQAGVIRNVYRLTFTNDRLTGKRLIARNQTAAMQPEVVDVGTEARPAPVSTPSTPAVVGSAGGLDWQALADCESGDDPSDVSADGLYYGLYQFDVGTWQSVGGTGTPAQASAAEQTSRAELLYERDGTAPWPVCGHYLS